MHKINKNNKSGFTLVEMVLVVLILLILATVVTLNVTAHMERANKASEKVDKQVSSMETNNAARLGKLRTYGF